MRAEIQFTDPDNITDRMFVTSQFLSGNISKWIIAPHSLNWHLVLDRPVRCFDASRRSYLAKDFLLSPNGMEAEKTMSVPPTQGTGDISVDVSLIANGQNLPDRVSYRDYERYPLISAGRLRVLSEG